MVAASPGMDMLDRQTSGTDPRTCDVAIIGAGPTGLTLANVLGLAGLDVVLVERNASTVQAPRAVSIDDECLRTMQAIGLSEKVIANVALDYGLRYLSPKGKCFAQVEPKAREFGYPRRNAFSQPIFEATLREGLERFASVETLFQHTCEQVSEDATGVDVPVRGPDGAEKAIRATYVVGSDGGRSQLRKIVGATLQGETYPERWLIVDLASTQERLRLTRVLCDPARPTICLPGPDGIRRYEFMLKDSETEEEITRPDVVHAMLAAAGPDADAPIVRAQVYTFHARVADKWNTRRIFIGGDAAHLTPPFAGQGMNSGVRDAHNLGWKLAAVLKGELGEGLLASYQREREPHAKALIEFAQMTGKVMMPTSNLQAMIVQTAFQLSKLIPPLHDYFAQYKYKPKPFYMSGFLEPNDSLKLVGRMLPQPFVELRDRTIVRFDTLAGNGFALVAVGFEAQDVMARALGETFDLPIGARIAVVPYRFNVTPGDQPDVQAVRDIDDTLAKIAQDREVLLLVRPDRYVAAAADVSDRASIAAFAASVRGLVRATRIATPAATPMAAVPA